MQKTIDINPARTLLIVTAGLLFVLLGLMFRPGGIGGTGIEGGIGGTGISTGFVGRIDGFGSIFVKGAEIFYDDDLVVHSDAGVQTAATLKVGQIVHVLAGADKDGVLHARALTLRFAVSGPVQALGAQRATINGQTVVLPPAVAPPSLGQNVKVSGFRRADGVIIASRIDPAGEASARIAPALVRPFVGKTDQLSLSGYVQKTASGYYLYGYKIEDETLIKSPAGLTTIKGKARDGTLRITSISRQPARQVAVMATKVKSENAAKPVDKVENPAPPVLPRKKPARVLTPQERPARPVAPVRAPAAHSEISSAQSRPDTNRQPPREAERERQIEDEVPAREEDDAVLATGTESRSTEAQEETPIREEQTPPKEVTPTRDQEPAVQTRPAPPERIDRPRRPQRPERIDRPRRPERPPRPRRP